jgi:hypothetical protein
MSPPEHVLDLLLRYEEGREQGQSLTPEELCRDCPELLPEVRRHLADLQQLDSVLQTPSDTELQQSSLPPQAMGMGEALFPEGRAGRVDQRYHPLRFHARGGLGEVFRAYDEELHREVALKRMQARHGGSPANRRRFLWEAEITGRLEHPGVVPVYGLGQDAQGQPCYAMRFIEGETLHAAIQRFHAAANQGHDQGERRLAFRGLLNHFVAVCNTVAYAHSRGVIHRDLKPANVMLGKYGETLVVDWGLAKPVERTEADRLLGEETLEPTPGSGEDATHLGLAMGTPAFMSPEQVAGRWDAVGPASDIFSLGAILYALLTGRAPYPGGKEEAMARASAADYPLPRRVNPATPRALEAVCLKALAPNPADRYATALELAAEVERWLVDERVRAYREPWKETLGRLGRRHRAVTTGAAILLVAGVIALVVGNLVIEEARQAEADQRHKAEIARQAAQDQAQAEQKAREDAVEAGQKLLRASLAEMRGMAERGLASARAQRFAPGRLRRQQEALTLIRRAAALEPRARAALQNLGRNAGQLARTEPAAWDRLRTDLRTEATWWLSSIGLGRERSVLLPPPPADNTAFVLRSLAGATEVERTATPWLGWVGLLALSPDGSQVALAYAGARELLVVALRQEAVRRLPLPPGMQTIRLGDDCDSLRFAPAGQIELTTVAERVSWTWPGGRVRSRRLSSRESEQVKRRITDRQIFAINSCSDLAARKEAVMARKADWTASVLSPKMEGYGNSQMQVVVRRRGKPPEGRLVFSAPGTVFSPRLVTFGSDPRFLYLFGNRLLVQVDVASGVLAGAEVFKPGSPHRCVALVPAPQGVATLEIIPGQASPRLRLTFWSSFTPRLPRFQVPHILPAASLATAGLRQGARQPGPVVTGGTDHVVRLWQGTGCAGLPAFPR